MVQDGIRSLEAAKYVGYDASWFTRLRQSGKGPAYYLDNGRIRYRRSDLDVWLENHPKRCGRDRYDVRDAMENPEDVPRRAKLMLFQMVERTGVIDPDAFTPEEWSEVIAWAEDRDHTDSPFSALATRVLSIAFPGQTSRVTPPYPVSHPMSL
jgi:hypothetical protein